MLREAGGGWGGELGPGPWWDLNWKELLLVVAVVAAAAVVVLGLVGLGLIAGLMLLYDDRLLFKGTGADLLALVLVLFDPVLLLP